MSLLNKILDQFYANKNNTSYLLILRVLSIINIGIITFILIISFIKSSNISIYFSITAILFLGANFSFTFLKRVQKLSSHNFLIILFLFSSSLIIYPLNEIFSIYFILFPINAFYVLGNKNGNLISALLLPVYIILLFTPNLFNLKVQLDITTSIILIFSYFSLHSILYFHEFFKENEKNRLLHELNDIKKITSQKDKFLSSLSHQLRTPLNNISVVTNILNTPELDPKQKDLLDTIQASANNLANVINNISEMPDIDTAENADYIIQFDLFSTIENTIKLYQENQKNLKFNLSLSKDINSNLSGNPIRLKQVFLNLIESIIVNKTESSIEIGVSAKINLKAKNSLKLLFEITSNQPLQIPLDQTKKQYITPLKSTEKNKTLELITLLDLTIANRIIEDENESLNINIQNEITKFSFILNFKIPEDKNKESMNNASRSESDSLISEFKDTNILLVEDNIINQKIVLLSLKKIVKNIDVANNGKEALDMFGSTKYDVILMDIQMPIMNGIVATKKIREIEASTDSHTPIIAITANALLGDKENCITAGMDDYISKPFQIEVLLKKMKAQIESSSK